MILEDLTSFLDEHSIDYKEAGRSLVLKECPACGGNDWKVHLKIDRDDEDAPFLGKCFHGSCEEGYSSIKYLIRLGIDKSSVLALHGLEPNVALASFLPELDNFERPERAITKAISNVGPVNINGFFKISDWPDHPASLYAIKRGLPKELYSTVYINPKSNSVVFICKDGDKIVGYQERFVKPDNDKFKTKSSDGFEKSKHVLSFPRDGKKVVICEGPFTAMSAYVYGYYGVCTFGANVSREQIEKIVDICTRTGTELGIAVEKGEAGAKNYLKIRSAAYWLKKDVFNLVPSVGKSDLNDCLILNGSVSETKEDWLGPSMPLIPNFI